jgi:hypothetical protein
VKEYPVADDTPQEDTYKLYVPWASPEGRVKSAVCASPGLLGTMELKLNDRA